MLPITLKMLPVNYVGGSKNRRKHRKESPSLSQNEPFSRLSRRHLRRLSSRFSRTVRATISANLPFRWIADPEVLRLLMMLRSAIGDALPSPNQVSGTLLDLEEKRVTDNVKTILRGQYVTVSIDGWSDKASVLGVDVSFDGKAYLVRSVSMKGRGKDGPAMCRTFIEMIDWVELEYACNVVGFCCDNDGGSQKGRKLLRVERPWLFNPPCCAHQGQLILADYFKENRDGSQTSEETADMLGWIRSHEKVRDIFDEVQVEKKGGEPLAYLVANLTRWTTHTISFHRTLSLKEPLRHAAILRCADILQAQLGAEKNKKKIAAVEKEVNRFCELLDDPGYWKRLERVSEDIEPVCYITNINQADNTRADQVLLGLAGVYLHFSRHPDPIVRAGMLARLEKRWEALDQPMFLFAVILNPYEKTDRFGGEAAVSVFTLASILVELYTRVKLRKLPDQDLSEVESRKQGEVRAAFMHYISGTGPFADFETNQEVFSQTNGTDPILVWQTFRSVAQVSELAELAMILLGLSVNQGGNERDFSDWKVKRTRLRNRLSFTKTTKMSKTVFKKNGTHERITMTTVSPN
ncbi:unnamed protein product [Mycena citricolor]|uniref:DUF659 domain-containing protein n=1 Tax=Mycena citricolor TaxID=2018698 RepID=A0AAD2HI74_9AGAR|nr:unnamed protein product [Mycena citricolor]